MRITFVIPQLAIGGAERQLIRTANAIVDHGADVSIVSTSVLDEVLSVEEPDPRLKIVFQSREIFAVRRAVRLGSSLRGFRPDRVVAWLPSAWAWSTLVAPAIRPAKLFVAERCTAPDYGPLMRRSRLICARSADRILANSRSAAQIWRSAAPAQDVREIVNFLPERVAPVRPVSGSTIRFAIVGRLVRQKGVDLALEALAEVRRTGLMHTLTVIGTGSEESSYRALVEKLNLGAAVRWCAPTMRSLAELRRCADVVLLPSRVEGQSNVLAESLAFGFPVLASRAHDLPVNGIVVPTVDVEETGALARAILAEEWNATSVASNAWKAWQDRARQTAVDGILN